MKYFTQLKFFFSIVFIMLCLLILTNCIKSFPYFSTNLISNSDTIYTIAFSPDSQTLASSGKDKVIRIWEYKTKKLVQELSGHNNLIYYLKFSPNGKTLVSGSQDGTTKFWDLSNNILMRTINTTPAYGGDISSDGRTLVCVTSGSLIKFYNIIDGQLKKSIYSNNTANPTSILYSRNDNFIFVAGQDSVITMLDTNGVFVKKFIDLSQNSFSDYIEKFVLSFAISPDGNFIIGGNSIGVVNVWSINNGKLLATSDVFDGVVFSVALSPDGKFISGASSDKTIKTLYANSGDFYDANYDSRGPLFSIAYSIDGKYIASGGADKIVRLWQIKK
ncbi:MAG: WD40 repeat domain-containing protein [Alphaproteobacteria bacterium]|nr:WD40 repeat domain-containing protein [Alphaproteobacteria bacterium]